MFRNRARQDAESGAVAIITALVVVFVLLPISALGVANYSRSGVTAEVQRAGDSGALAGAAGLTLLNLGSLPQASLLNNLGLPVSPAAQTLNQACLATQKAFGIPNPAIPASPTTDLPKVKGNPNSPVSGAFGQLVHCTAKYAPDPTLAQCIANITNAVNGVVLAPITRYSSLVVSPTILVLGIPVPNPLYGTLQTVLGLLTGPTAITGAVTNLVPALVHNGVIVDLDYSVRGPLDSLLGQDTPTQLRSRSTSRRIFKPLLPLGLKSTVGNGITGALTSQVGLTSALSALDPSVTVAERLVVADLQLTLTALRLLADGTSGPLAVTTLQPLLTNTDQILSTVVGPALGLLAPLLGPVTLPSLSTVLNSSCRDAVTDLIDDLSAALTINEDPTDQGLLPCLTEQVLGLTPGQLGRALITTQACANRVFRATLGPNPAFTTIPFGNAS